MKVNKTAIIILLLICCATTVAQPSYTKADSCIITRILQQKGDTSIENIAMQFIGIPYVAGTLDREKEERLTINLQELDCTTFVEQITAISLTANSEKKDFEEFCNKLNRLRYRNGKCSGYSSRLHYISQWIEQAERSGLLYETRGKAHQATQILNLNFMSKHPESYRQLRENPLLIKEIEEGEKAFKNIKIEYIPKELLNRGPEELEIKNGDILAIVTAIEGLDVSHIGFALWKNNNLHLIHASSSKGETIIDKETLYDYMKSKKNNLGIRVFRAKRD